MQINLKKRGRDEYVRGDLPHLVCTSELPNRHSPITDSVFRIINFTPIDGAD